MSPSLPVSALFLGSTTTYSESDSPSLAMGVGGNAPGICGVEYEGWASASSFRPDVGLTLLGCASDVVSREVRVNSEASGLVGLSAFVGLEVKVSPRAARCRGLDLPFDLPCPGLALAALFNLSSVARRRASRASSSDSWEETARFL